MKKILRLLLQNLDKIVLAILLLMLISVIGVQLKGYLRIMELIENTKKIDTSTKTNKKLIPPLATTIFDAKVEVEESRTWQPAYTVGMWGSLKPEVIYKDHPKPPPVMDRDLRGYVEKYGPSTLFDPPVYVVPIDRKPYLLDFGSARAFYPPFRIDYVEDRDAILNKTVAMANPEDDDDDNKPVQPVIKETPLIQLFRLGSPKPSYRPMPFSLSSVIRTKPDEKAEWNITLKIGNRASIIKLNDKVPGTDYVIEDVEFEERTVKSGEMVFKEKTFKITVAKADGTGQKVVMDKGDTRVTDPNSEPYYDVMCYPYGKRPKRIKSGDTIKVEYGTQRGEYMLVMEGETPMIVEIEDGSQIGKPIALPRFDEEDFDKWQKQEKSRSTPKPPTGQPGTPDIEMPPGMMPPGMMPPELMPPKR